MPGDLTQITPPHYRARTNRTVGLLRDFLDRNAVAQGARLPAEARLARDFNVSRMTLRSAMQVLENEGLIRRERNVGCVRASRPAQATSMMSRTIVLVSNLQTAANGQIFSGSSDAVMSGVLEGVARREMNIFRINSFDEKDFWLQELINSRPHGVIVCWWKPPSAWQWKMLDALVKAGLPTVTFAHSSAFDRFDAVGTDHHSGSEQLVRALAAAGKRRILRVWSCAPEVDWIKARDQGYEAVANELGLDVLPAVTLEGLIEREQPSEARFRVRARQYAGYLVEHLTGSNPIDAIMVSTDSDALAALAACRLFGRTDIAVVGYDNYWHDMPELAWEAGRPFATVDKNNHLIGEQMVELLMQRIGNALPASPQKRVVEQKLVLTAEQGPQQ